MDEDVQDPFGYASPPRSPDHQFAVCAGSTQQQPAAPSSSSFGSPAEATNTSSPTGGDEGTPKVPLVPFAGRPEKACPPAPKKGKAPTSFYDHVSGEAPVRRLSFGGADACAASPEPSGAIDSMDEDCDQVSQPQHAQQQQQHRQHDWQWQQQGTPTAAGAHPADLHIPQQQAAAAAAAAMQHHEQLLLSPSPPPVQQLFSQQHQQHPASQGQVQQQQRPASVQQQLFMPASAPGSGRQLRPQQLWPCQQQQQSTQQQQPQAVWGNPLSPTGAPRPSVQQGSSTPARLFR